MLSATPLAHALVSPDLGAEFGADTAPFVEAPDEWAEVYRAADSNSDVATVQAEHSSSASRLTPRLSDAGQLRRELILVDTAARDYELLLDDLLSQATAEREFEVRLLNGQTDGIQQISSILAEFSELDAVHLVSHGDEGAVKLGNTWLSLDNLGTYSDELINWRDALNSSADLLFYGCDLAASEDGRSLLDWLGTLCDCDVAASTDDTGHALLGGDWDFEYQSGNVETEVAFSDTLQSQWLAVLSYNQTQVSWTPTASNSWETKDLSPNVSPNAVLEIALQHNDTAASRILGLRAEGSLLERKLELTEADDTGSEVLVMHVQADVDGQIQTFASSSANVTYTLLDGSMNSGTVTVSVDISGNFGPPPPSPPSGGGGGGNGEPPPENPPTPEGDPPVQAPPATGPATGGGNRVAPDDRSIDFHPQVREVRRAPVLLSLPTLRVASAERPYFDVIRETAQPLVRATVETADPLAAAPPLTFVSPQHLWDKLEQLQREVNGSTDIHFIAGSVAFAAWAMAATYVVWTLKGGYLLASFVSQMPAWRFIDPLPICDGNFDFDFEEGDEHELDADHNEEPSNLT